MDTTNRDPTACRTILTQPALHAIITMCAPLIPSVYQIKCATTHLTIVNVNMDSTSPHTRKGASVLLLLQSFLQLVLLSIRLFVLQSELHASPQFALLFGHQHRYATVTTPAQSTPTASQIVNVTVDLVIVNVTVATTNLQTVIQHVSQTITKTCNASELGNYITTTYPNQVFEE